MSISDLYDTAEHTSNSAHFMALVNLAQVDGTIKREEEIVLGRLAVKLNISDEEYKAILKNPERNPYISTFGLEERIERLRDLFSVIYADYTIDSAEEKLIFKYAIALGFSGQRAKEEIEKCKRKFGVDSELKN
ncbi:TerB family tellurite resistance protein [Maribacter halichondriae]|uniref:TerB family tellurite resistance protein n=1 Tax=Maribacter halichondriae TaxID=2980554 RepID=UPI002358A12A|nr:TerB family tellurite resistance protein [Maribacter sp. Hal144]